MRKLTTEEIATVLAEANLQLFRRGLRTYVRIEHPLVGGLEFDTASFLALLEQNAQDAAVNKLTAFLTTWLAANDVQPL